MQPPPTPPLPPPRTRGAELLATAASARNLSLRALARLLDVRSPESVRNWLHGTKTPATGARERISATFGIPCEAWDAPTTAPPDQSTATPTPAPASATREIGAPLAELDRLLHELEARVPHLTPTQYLKALDTRAKLIAQRAKIMRDVELSEDRIVREHPAFVRLCDLILGALEQHPQAALAVSRALADDRERKAHDAPATNGHAIHHEGKHHENKITNALP